MRQNKQSKWSFKRTLIAGLSLLAVIVMAGCGAAVKYDGGQISEEQLNGYLGSDKLFNYERYTQYESDPTFMESNTKQYVAFLKLTENMTDAEKKDADKKASEQYIQIEEQFKSQPAPNNDISVLLKQLKITEKDVKNYISLGVRFVDTMKKKFPADQDEARYNKIMADNKNAFDRVTLSHILVAFTDQEGKARTKEAALARVNEAKEKLDGGGDFAALAKEYSDDGNRDDGGTYADADPNLWVEPFKKAALELPLDEISEPVETEYGYHIIKVASRKALPFEEVQAQVHGMIIDEFFTEYMTNEIPGIIKEINMPKAKT